MREDSKCARISTEKTSEIFCKAFYPLLLLVLLYLFPVHIWQEAEVCSHKPLITFPLERQGNEQLGFDQIQRLLL